MKTKYFYAIMLMVFSLVTPTICIVKKIQFNQDCAGYLKQTADANTVEIALERLNMAIAYVEGHHLTHGYTSVLWKTEDENIAFWYRNLKACQQELSACIGGTQLEKSNVLMKVRESLTDNGDSGINLTIPDGISRYPDNSVFLFWGIMSILMFAGGFIWSAFISSEYL